jgi:hypothetical protein
MYKKSPKIFDGKQETPKMRNPESIIKSRKFLMERKKSRKYKIPKVLLKEIPKIKNSVSEVRGPRTDFILR